MAESLLTILLVTSSAKGSSLVYRWPPSPHSSARLTRPHPENLCISMQLDNPWKASYMGDGHQDATRRATKASNDDECDYYWKRPVAMKERSLSFSKSPGPSSGRSSPTKDGGFDVGQPSGLDEYDHLFGYSTEFLAGMLCPQRSMCHQKFELVVDDLAFIGHPVCADSDGVWRFKQEKIKHGGRGRESRETRSSDSPHTDERSASSETSSVEPPVKSSWLHTFHLVLVLDLPDPSSSASGNVLKYFDIIYEQIAFTITAILYQEQVLSNFVELECDTLGSLKDSCASKGEPFAYYISQALERSSIAPAMKAIFEAVTSSSIAYITLHNIPLELQLPPYLDSLLHSEGDNDVDSPDIPEDEDQAWGPEMSFGWRLPSLAPWKSLLLLDGHDDVDPYTNLRGPHLNADDQTLADGLIRFLETASVKLSLTDMASLLDWDLESQIYPTVRWLVHHRRAKIVDTVHSGLRTVFTLPPKFDQPLSQLVVDFDREFSHPSMPPLPRILSTISTSRSKQTDNHFFASVVKSKELIPMYHDVVLWMLKRDMLITLHLRIRIVATRDLKLRVRLDHEKSLARKSAGRTIGRGRNRLKQQVEMDELDEAALSAQTRSGIAWLSMSPRSARRYSRRLPSNESGKSEISELVIEEEETGVLDDEKGKREELTSEFESDLDEEDSGWDTTEDHLWPSMINDPGRATPLQRRWLSAMSEGKEPHVARRFELINQYFDGKKSDDEILFRADISRKQLREVLHHYEEYLQTFLHPS